jgi:hypothetical protein
MIFKDFVPWNNPQYIISTSFSVLHSIRFPVAYCRCCIHILVPGHLFLFVFHRFCLYKHITSSYRVNMPKCKWQKDFKIYDVSTFSLFQFSTDNLATEWKTISLFDITIKHLALLYLAIHSYNLKKWIIFFSLQNLNMKNTNNITTSSTKSTL